MTSDSPRRKELLCNAVTGIGSLVSLQLMYHKRINAPAVALDLSAKG